MPRIGKLERHLSSAQHKQMVAIKSGNGHSAILKLQEIINDKNLELLIKSVEQSNELVQSFKEILERTEKKIDNLSEKFDSVLLKKKSKRQKNTAEKEEEEEEEGEEERKEGDKKESLLLEGLQAQAEATASFTTATGQAITDMSN
mgnify:CR=1 FL=1